MRLPEDQTGRNGFLLVLGGCAGLVLGALLPWITVRTAFGEITQSGVDDGGDGLYLLIAAVVVAALLLTRPNLPPWLVVLVGAGAAIGALYDYMQVRDRVDAAAAERFLTASVGAGMYLTLAGAVALLAGGVALMVAARATAPVVSEVAPPS